MSAIAPEPDTDVVIDLVDAVAVLGSFPALAGATLSVRRGEIVLLRGPNGAGKSTTLKSISTMLASERGEVTKGTISYDGTEIKKQTPDPVLILVFLEVLL